MANPENYLAIIHADEKLFRVHHKYKDQETNLTGLGYKVPFEGNIFDPPAEASTYSDKVVDEFANDEKDLEKTLQLISGLHRSMVAMEVGVFAVNSKQVDSKTMLLTIVDIAKKNNVPLRSVLSIEQHIICGEPDSYVKLTHDGEKLTALALRSGTGDMLVTLKDGAYRNPDGSIWGAQGADIAVIKQQEGLLGHAAHHQKVVAENSKNGALEVNGEPVSLRKMNKTIEDLAEKNNLKGSNIINSQILNEGYFASKGYQFLVVSSSHGARFADKNLDFEK